MPENIEAQDFFILSTCKLHVVSEIYSSQKKKNFRET